MTISQRRSLDRAKRLARDIPRKTNKKLAIRKLLASLKDFLAT